MECKEPPPRASNHGLAAFMKPHPVFVVLLATLALVSLLLARSPRTEEAVSLSAILPPVLHDANGKKVDPATLEGKTVALYFSAHWCPPCRAFTPSLVKFRDEHADQDFEVVFVSLDHSEGEKRGYIREMEMKWPSVPGTRSKAANALAKRFQVRGIPALVVLAPDGSLVTPDGREDVMNFPQTALRKWTENDPS